MSVWSNSAFFAAWLNRQKDSVITPNMVKLVDVDNKKLTMGDLICVMYYGDDQQSLKALKHLRDCFETEMYFVTQNQGVEREISWD